MRGLGKDRPPALRPARAAAASSAVEKVTKAKPLVYPVPVSMGMLRLVTVP